MSTYTLKLDLDEQHMKVLRKALGDFELASGPPERYIAREILLAIKDYRATMAEVEAELPVEEWTDLPGAPSEGEI